MVVLMHILEIVKLSFNYFYFMYYSFIYKFLQLIYDFALESHLSRIQVMTPQFYIQSEYSCTDNFQQ